MSSSVLAEVRDNCRKVAEQALLVGIDLTALAGYAATLPRDRLFLPEMDPAIHYLGHGQETLAYYLTLDAVNFGSGYFPEIFGDPRRSGYRTIAAALTRHFSDCGPIAPEKLARLSVEECAGVFGFDTSSAPAAELMMLYTTALNDLGTFLCESYGGAFDGIVVQAGQSAVRLVEILTEMTLFNDVASYGGLKVPFHKRAQLTAVDLCIAFDGKERGCFHDLDCLTICADNLVPHVLRLDGILRYEEGLAARIDQGVPLEAGSPEEVEIRACSVHAGELIVAELRCGGQKINAMLLDNLLWHKGQEPFYRERPRHRTRTVFY